MRCGNVMYLNHIYKIVHYIISLYPVQFQLYVYISISIYIYTRSQGVLSFAHWSRADLDIPGITRHGLPQWLLRPSAPRRNMRQENVSYNIYFNYFRQTAGGFGLPAQLKSKFSCVHLALPAGFADRLTCHLMSRYPASLLHCSILFHCSSMWVCLKIRYPKI